MQAIPELAKVVGELYVFQRTPSTIDVRDQRATTPEEIDEWSQRAGLGEGPRGPGFAKISAGRTALQANDDYLAGKVADFKERKQHERELTPEELIAEAARHELPRSWSRSAPGSTPSSRTRRPPRR